MTDWGSTALQEFRERFELAVRGTTDGFWDWDIRNERIWFAPRWKELLGYEDAEFENTFEAWETHLHPEDRDAVLNALHRHIGQDRPYDIEYRLRTKTGAYRWFRARGTSVRDGEGKAVRMAGAIQDITEQKTAEEERRGSEEKLLSITESSPDYIMLLDRDANILFINRTVPDLTVDDVLGTPVYNYVPEKGRRAMRECFERVLATGRPDEYEVEFHTSSGDILVFESRVGPVVHDGEVTGMSVTSSDVTQRRRTERALRSLYAVAAEKKPFPKRVERLLRMGCDFFDMEVGILSRVSGGRYEVREVVAPERLGIARGATFDLENTFCAKTLEAGGPVSFGRAEETAWARHPAYRDLGLESYVGTPVAGRGGVIGTLNFSSTRPRRRPFSTVDHDVIRLMAQWVEAELERERLEAQMQHAQKLESLGVLAGGIAHDFNNLLVGILGNAGLALRELPPAARSRRFLTEIEKAAQRAAELSNQMLAYSGKGSFQVRAVDLNDLVDEMVHLLEVSISKKATLRIEFAEALPAIEGDSTQIRQVVMNLITNASEALGEESGAVIVRTGTVEADREYLSRAYLDNELEEGTYVFLEVEDTGRGMAPATLSRIFDPFFTTKFAGRGLGLAAVLGIARGHRGAIRIESDPERGTTFRVLFPASDRPAEAAEPAAAPVSEHGSGTVLVVDDEEAVRTLARLTLEGAGFDVLSARDGSEALDVLRDRGDGIVAVVLDMTMPEMGGEETFRELRRRGHGMPVILSSGYHEQHATDRFAGDLAGFIQKPYRPPQLVEAVRRAIAP